MLGCQPLVDRCTRRDDRWRFGALALWKKEEAPSIRGHRATMENMTLARSLETFETACNDIGIVCRSSLGIFQKESVTTLTRANNTAAVEVFFCPKERSQFLGWERCEKLVTRESLARIGVKPLDQGGSSCFTMTTNRYFIRCPDAERCIVLGCIQAASATHASILLIGYFPHQ
eukprot:scaffold406_cov162-Pinguiococcus_pyrenoidosus.AAC.2